MLAPERRTRTDLAIALAIGVVVALFVGLMWWTSDSRNTTSTPMETTLPPLPSASAVPDTVSELWHAKSTRTPAAIAVRGSVVTADGSTIVGHDAVSGRELWRYAGPEPLCDVISTWSSTLAVYRNSLGCGDVIVLKGADGSRDVTRNSDADDQVDLTSDGTYVVSRGNTRMEVWRSDLVRTLEYGRVDDQNVSDAQPRTGCALVSAVSSSAKLALVEDCATDAGLRLSILDPAPKDAAKPEELASTIIPNVDPDDATVRLLAAGSDRFAAYIAEPGKPARIVYFDQKGEPDGEKVLPSAFTADPVTSKAGSVVMVWGGSEVFALDTITLDVRWSRAGALGPGALMAHDLLLPVKDGIAVIDPETGKENRIIRVKRDSNALVTTAVSGDVIVEQRGTDVVALR